MQLYCNGLNVYSTYVATYMHNHATIVVIVRINSYKFIVSELM